MNNLIKINNKEIKVKEFENQRVVTFKDIDMVHERLAGTASMYLSSEYSPIF